MTVNEGTLDRVIRAIFGLTLLYLAFFSGSPTFASGIWHWVAIIGGILMLFTAITGFCALYKVLGIRTKK